MEEIYIVKLKGLPPPPPPPPVATSQDLKTDSKASFYYETDLTAEAIRGFSYLHIFFGLTVLCLSVTNLCFHENPLSLEPPLGISVWCSLAFILLGLFGLLTAHKRKYDLSRSILFVKIHFVLIIVVLSLTLTFIILFTLDLHGPIANHFIGLNIVVSIVVETVLLLLTLFTTARILWPSCIRFCAKNWPMQPKMRRKVIVKTNIYTGGIAKDESSVIQSCVGPNCVISLNMAAATGDQQPQLVPPLPSSSPALSRVSIPTNVHRADQLTNSTSTLCTVPSVDYNDYRFGGIHRSIYYNYPITRSNTSLLQTFPIQDSRNNRTVASLYGEEVNPSLPDIEDIDLYDTDEFDYCTTEDEEDPEPMKEANECSGECHTCVSPTSTDDENQPNADQPDNESCGEQAESGYPDQPESESPNQSSGGSVKFDSVSEPESVTPTIQHVFSAEEERDEGIASSGSSTCSSEEVSHPFQSTLKLTSFPTSGQTVGPPNESKFKPATVVNRKSSYKCNTTTTTTTTPATKTPTIRLLNTNKSKAGKVESKDSSLSPTSSSHALAVSSSKLESHPYLCRLRASNVDHFERRYPKLVNTESSSIPQSIANYREPQPRIPDIQRV